MKDTTIAVGLAKNVFEIAISREAGKVRHGATTMKRDLDLIREILLRRHPRHKAQRRRNSAAMLRVLIFLVSLGARAIRAMCRCRADLVIENLALRQQVTALKKERPRPPLEDTDRAFWVALRSSWPAWASRLVIVNADTVARWNRDRFRRYWARISRPRYPGRPRIDAEIRRLVRTMAQDGWGAPRIHAELTKLGFVVWLRRRRAIRSGGGAHPLAATRRLLRSVMVGALTGLEFGVFLSRPKWQRSSW